VQDTAFLEFQQNTRRAENVSGIQKSGTDSRRQFDALVITHLATETTETVQRIEGRIERFGPAGLTPAATPCTALLVAGLLFLEPRRVEQHQPCQVDRRRSRNDFSAETPFDQQRNAAAMVEVSMGEQQVIDLRRSETERRGILLDQFPAALVHAAIDQ